jgi:uncharacterized protein YigE (DUF2233 family)
MTATRLCLLLLLPFAGVAADFSKAERAGKRVTVCRVDLRKERLQVFLHDSGQPFKSFEMIDRFLLSRGERLAFAMNAGIYHPNFSPVGLLVADGKQLAPLNTNSGFGNFFLKPNGVFLVTDSGPRVIETSEYPPLQNHAILATQSGPLLVRAGKINAAFNTNSTSRLIRNGVGVAGLHVVVFAISETPLNFYEFASLFRDTLACPDALYLDGVISSLHAPPLNRSDNKADLGPILAVTEPRR